MKHKTTKYYMMPKKRSLKDTQTHLIGHVVGINIVLPNDLQNLEKWVR